MTQKNDPTTELKTQKRQYWVILMIVFLGFLGISIPYLIFPALFLNPEYSILPTDWSLSSRSIFLGITLAAYPLGQFIGSPILGSLSDEYGRKQLLIASLLVTAFCNLLSAFAIDWQTLSLLIASRFCAGLMEGNIAIARAMASELTLISKHDSFGKINAASSIAYLLGPLIGGLMTDKSLFENLTISTPFYFICFLFFGITALTAYVLNNDTGKYNKHKSSIWQRLNILKRISNLFSNKLLQYLMITSTCFTLAVDIFYEFGPVYLTIKWDLAPADLVIYNAVICIALVIGNGYLPAFFSTRVSNRLEILFTLGGFALLMIGIVLANTMYLMLGLFILCGLAIGLATTLLIVKISDSVPDAIQGEVMGVQLSLRVLGDALICLFGGVFLLVSSKLILIVAAMLSLGAMAYFAFKEPKHL